MDNLILIAVIVLIVGLAGFYIYKAKKNGRRCVGCPESGCNCSGEKGGCCGCGGNCQSK